MPIKVAVTDDHPMVLSGLQHALASSEDVVLTGAYTTGSSLLEALPVQRPDVLLLDLQMPDMPGRTIAQIILKQYRDIKILILSSLEDIHYIQEMMELGCSGYLLKSNTDHNLLLQAIQKAYYGEIFMEAALSKQLLTGILKNRKKSEKTMALITQKEKEILAYIVDGLSSSRIAEQLGISARTVETHRYSLMQKLDVKNAPELVKKAMELHLLK
jgi:DNA-binding NarL/FixJ family response regulator